MTYFVFFVRNQSACFQKFNFLVVVTHCIPKIMVLPLMHAATASREPLYNICQNLQSRRSCMQQWWELGFFIIYTEIAVLPYIHGATVNTELLYDVYWKSQVSWLLHAATAIWKPLYNIHRNLQSRFWYMQQQRAQSFFITYTKNCNLAVHACSNCQPRAFFMIYTENCGLPVDAYSNSELRASL